MDEAERAHQPRVGRSALSGILRDHTADAHRAAEAAMSVDFCRPGASEYLAVLKGLSIFHAAVAQFSRETVARELGPDLVALHRGPALRTDIRLMSQRVTDSAEGASARSREPEGPIVTKQLRGGREERIGAAYVAAGSVLGGRLIAARLTAGPGSDFPRSFFASEGLDVGRLWRRFKTALDAFGESGADPARVTAGALAAFTLIRDVLGGPPNATTGAT